jgi:hypothetical protein
MLPSFTHKQILKRACGPPEMEQAANVPDH